MEISKRKSKKRGKMHKFSELKRMGSEDIFATECDIINQGIAKNVREIIEIELSKGKEAKLVEIVQKLLEPTPKEFLLKVKNFYSKMDKVLPEDLKKVWEGLDKKIVCGAVFSDEWVRYSGIRIGEQDLMLFSVDDLVNIVKKGLKKVYVNIKDKLKAGAKIEHFPWKLQNIAKEISEEKI